MPPCNGDCNQGRECNCGCKMTKDEALRMALRWITDVSTNNEDEVIQACKEALAQPSNMVTIPLDKLEDMQRRLKEPTVVELNDEYLRDTHVEGMPKDGDCCTEGCIKCDARKVLTETQHWLCLDGQMVVAQLYNLVEILNDPMKAYPHNFSTPAKGNALLFGLCQEAADEIELLKAKLRELDNA